MGGVLKISCTSEAVPKSIGRAPPPFPSGTLLHESFNYVRTFRVRMGPPNPLCGAVLRMSPEKPRPRVTAGVAR
jgi:hypothetical protein